MKRPADRTGILRAFALAVALLIPPALWSQGFDYTPLPGGSIPHSLPEERGMDRRKLQRLYDRASRLETIKSLLIIKDGFLVAEGYWHGGGPREAGHIQSVTKSFVGALTGIALEEGAIGSLDQPMLDFFPELAGRVSDPGKREITIRHLLQMRAGYPWEESDPLLFDILYRQGFRTGDILRFPLIREPGTDHDYSNLSSHILAVIISRATGRDLLDYAGEKLFAPLGIEPEGWTVHWEGYRGGHAGLQLTAREMAAFALMISGGGRVEGGQIVPRSWIEESLAVYSTDAWDYPIGRHVRHMGYGYQWWSVAMGDHLCHMAWGHGGQLIVLADDLDLIVIMTADPFSRRSDGWTWRREKANINLVADFIARGGAADNRGE